MTHFRFQRATAALALILAPLLHAGQPTVIRPDPAVTHGTWEGWGCSLAWMGKVFGNRADLADLFFTTKTVTLDGQPLPGLGFNIARYNAGASSTNPLADGRRMVVSNDILPFRQLDSFWLDPRSDDPASTSWDWSVDANQRAMLLMARDRGADRFELFSNSPPWWMCQNDNPSGAPKGDQDNLAPAHYADFARYLAAIARHAKDHWGLTFTTVEPFNEPTSHWWQANGKQEGCHVSAPEQLKILPLVRAALDAEGLPNIPLSASDESLTDQAIAAWKGYTPAAKALVAQVNVHGYQGAKGDRAGLHRLVTADGKPLWNSEYGDGTGTGLELAQNLQRDFDQLHPVAWCYWQPLDGGRQGKGGSGWGLLDADMNQARILKTNTKFFVLAQYSRHLRPGMVILETGDPHTVAAFDSTLRKLVIVALNDTAADRDATIDLSAFASDDAQVSSWLTQTDGPARYQPIATSPLGAANTFTTRLLAKSVQTFEFTGLAPAAPIIDRAWSGHPVSFAFLTERGHQFVAYYNADRRITVAGRTLGSTDWTIVHPEGVRHPRSDRPSNVTGWDSHNYLALALDRDGCLHLSGNMHNDPLVYYRTERPFDLATLRRLDRMTGDRENRVTYPVFFKTAAGDLLFRYRDGGSGNGSDLYNRYDPTTHTWNRLLDTPLLDGQGKRNAYALPPVLGPDHRFHLVWMWRDTPDCATNHTLSYARSADFIHWEKTDGTPLTLPITLDNAEVIDPAPIRRGLINMTFNLGFDATNRPVVVYHRYDAQNRSQAYAAHPRAGASGWDITRISDWHFRWDFSGGGSIAAEVTLGAPALQPDGTLLVDYATTHDAGSGRWRLDPETLRPLATLPAPDPVLPAALMSPESTYKGMEVQTAVSRDAGRRWVLRWETLPRNRDQPRADIPPPSALRIYEVPDTDAGGAATRVGS